MSHPQVEIDPAKPVPEWSLNDVGRSRVSALAQSDTLGQTDLIVSSGETKAIETAEPLSAALARPLLIRENMHENDRSATGFLPPGEFETVADQFFAHPGKSIRGWETAIAAQQRIVSEVRAVIADHPSKNILFVGHGGVGTLLYCFLSGENISRKFDQGPGGGGNYFDFSNTMDKPLSHWQSMENLFA